MSEERSFERFVADTVVGAAGCIRMPDDFYDDIRAHAGRTRQRPRWLAILKEPPMRHASHLVVGSPTARVTALGAATLLVALLGTAALVAGAQSPSPPPPAEAAPVPPTAFTGSWCIGPPVAPDRSGTTTRVDVGDEGMTLVRYRRGAWENTVTMSDPRLQGDAYQTYEKDTYTLPGAPTGPSLFASTLSIVNEHGAWVTAAYGAADANGTEMGNGPNVFIGQGAYEGLIAVMEGPSGTGQCADVQGFIFDGAPVAEAYLPE